jgi:RimJ/RimL family protein N-acetyltransferase
MSFLVRRAEPRDAPTLVELAREVGAEPEGWLIADGEWRSVGEERRHLRAVRASSHVAVFVAETEGGVVGRLTIAREVHPACSHVADVGLMVARRERRQGIGAALLKAAEDWAQVVGVRKIELHVFPHNETALALYERVGYVREGYRRAQFRRGRDLIDAILMAKLIE